MVGRGNPNTGFTLRPTRRPGGIGLRLLPSFESLEAPPLTEHAAGPTRHRETMGNSQPQNHLDTMDSSDDGYTMDDAEEEAEIFPGCVDEKQTSRRAQRRGTQNKKLALLDHELAHITKLRSTPNEMLSRINGMEKKCYVSILSYAVKQRN